MKLPIFTLAVLCLISCQVKAHTLLIKPHTTASGTEMHLMMTEHFFEGERALDVSTLSAGVVTSAGIHWLLADNTEKPVKVIRYSLPKETGSGMVYVTAKPRYRGITKGTKATSPETRLRIDDFAKVIWGVASDVNFVSGQALEIVPLQHPATLQNGKLDLQVLWKGKPFASHLVVFSPDGRKHRLTTDENGHTLLTVAQSGTWVVKVARKVEQGEDQFSGAYEASASLLFEIDSSN